MGDLISLTTMQTKIHDIYDRDIDLFSEERLRDKGNHLARHQALAPIINVDMADMDN